MPYASIGVPFTYRLNIPVLYDPATGNVIINNGSNNDLHTVVITDDLNATGVDLTVIGTPTVTWRTTGAPVPVNYTNVGNVLTFVIDPTNTGVQIPAGQQIAIDITVVLNNNPAVNTPGQARSPTSRTGRSAARSISTTAAPLIRANSSVRCRAIAASRSR